MDTTAVTDIDLRALAELEAAEKAFASLYFSSPEALGGFATRRERLAALLEDDAAEAEHFRENMALIEAWLEESSPPAGGCVFACWALGLCVGYSIDLPLPDLLRVGTSPYIRPLALLRDDYKTFLLIAADNQGTRIYVVTSGEAELEERVSGGVKNHVKKGGWSQKRYQRRRENELMHYAKDIAERLQELAEGEEFASLVLLGSEEAMQAIEEELPPSLAELPLRKKGIDLHEGEDFLLAEGLELYMEEERKAEVDHWQTVRSEALADGLAAMGATDVLLGLQNGRVETLILAQDAKVPGTKCRECENVVHGTPDTCQVCGSSSVLQLDLVDELTRLAEVTSAEVVFVQESEGLERRGGVAAMLRY